MINLKNRINAFVLLGKILVQAGNSNNHEGDADSKLFKLEQAIKDAPHYNGWFVEKNVSYMLNSLGKSLSKSNIEKWIEPHKKGIEKKGKHHTVGVVMAGNIPVVGFHDFLSILISGNKILAKLSSDDNKLLPIIADLLIEIEPAFNEMIEFTSTRLKNFDAIIATGSNNSSKYFEYYFGKYPNIIRKNRTSVAILNGNETEQDFKNLGNDIFTYYGLGCRNVSKLFVPDNYNFVPFLDALSEFEYVYINNKYANNRDYNSSVLLLNKVKHYDNNFLILTENIGYSAPISVVYFETYSNIETVYKRLEIDEEKIQCIVSNISDNFINFGDAQSPKINDYADNIDTLEFLLKL